MKKCLFTAIFSLIFGAAVFASATEVNEKVLKTFKETFPNAAQVNWQEFSDNYIVNFMVGDIRTRINYDKEGNFISATRYYLEQNLPVNILCKLRKNFPGQKVFGVTETESETSVEYYIKLEDDKNWTTVKSDSGSNLEVVEKYKKA
jgi:RNA binding exosome subunit